MKKASFLLGIGSVMALALFFGCSLFELPNVNEGVPVNTAYLEREE